MSLYIGIYSLKLFYIIKESYQSGVFGGAGWGGAKKEVLILKI